MIVFDYFYSFFFFRKTTSLKFKCYDDKKSLYEAKRKLKTFSGSGDRLNGAKKIYINEHLTAERKKLYAEVRKRAKQYQWFSYSTNDGKIFVKKNLEKLKNSSTTGDWALMICDVVTGTRFGLHAKITQLFAGAFTSFADCLLVFQHNLLKSSRICLTAVPNAVSTARMTRSLIK